MEQAGTVSTVWSLLAAACMVTGCLGCFLNDDTFAFNRVWKQKTTVNTYRIMTITTDVIKIECFQGQTLTKVVEGLFYLGGEVTGFMSFDVR
ncbi:hypothetical protein Btru_001737 [Bulinus truncatus]|nr:hypothetical protein Btru_001737 [Bulinus truncatus]